MNRKSIPARLDALERAAPKGMRAWAHVIVPLGLTPEESEELIAGERDKLPPGTGLVVVRLI